jgi:hypothetical protein
VDVVEEYETYWILRTRELRDGEVERIGQRSYGRQSSKRNYPIPFMYDGIQWTSASKKKQSGYDELL